MTKVRRSLIAGNWKMHGLRADGLALARDVAQRRAAHEEVPFDLLVCPPATLLHEVAELLTGTSVAVGGQDCHGGDHGPHTGDISAAMVRDAGCDYVIVGHSERRAEHGESDAEVQTKARAAHAAGITAIICIGETAADHASGRTIEVVSRHVEGSLPPGATPSNTVIAYEPVWAIGTGKTPTSEGIAAVHAAIRARLGKLVPDGDDIRILYGGSVKPGNCSEILRLQEVDGALVGGASLDGGDFWAIAESCL